MLNNVYESIPTDKNIYYMFSRLLLPIIISTRYEPYKDYWENYEELLIVMKNIIGIYYNSKSLKEIDNSYLNKLDDLINELKINCLTIDTRYIEEIDIWHGEFLEMWKNSCLEK